MIISSPFYFDDIRINGLHLVEFEFDLTFGFRVASPFAIEIIPLRF